MWEDIRSSLWFVPTVSFLVAAGAAVALIALDRGPAGRAAARLAWLFGGDADSARYVLSTIATSTLGVMGVTFSVTIVALNLSSTQFSPRMLHLFMRDRGVETTMGVFIATYAYALLVLRTVHGEGPGGEVGARFTPVIATAGGMVFGLASVGALIFFIHHIANSIQASNVIIQIGEETAPLLDRPFPAGVGAAFAGDGEALAGRAFADVPSIDSGYVDYVDGEALLALARKRDCVLRMECGPGDFVAQGMPLAAVDPGDVADAAFARAVARCVVLGQEHTMQQDPEFGMQQLMEIAVRALSPAYNDPTTAMRCIDQLRVLLRRAAAREDPPALRADAEGRLRLIAKGPTFRTMLGRAINQVRQDVAGDNAVTIRLLEVLRDVASAANDEARRALLWEQAVALLEASDARVPARRDREDIDHAVRELAAVVGRDPTPVLLTREQRDLAASEKGGRMG